MLALAVCPLMAQTEWYNNAQARIDTLRKGSFTIRVKNQQGVLITDSVRVIMKKHDFSWGYAVDLYDTGSPQVASGDDWQRAIMLKFCNFGVNGNSFKWSGIEPNQGVINYSGYDNTIAWFKKFGFGFKAHTLLWGGYNQTDYHCVPQWVMNLKSTPKVMYDTCRNRVMREVNHYKGIVKEYDVMNEPTHATTLQSIVGDSINWNCFKWAHEADPTAKLFINDFNIIEYQNQTDNFCNLVKRMIQNGAPVTGIGTQSHIGSTVDLSGFKSRLDQLGQFNLPIKITEFDMNYGSGPADEHMYAREISKMMRLCFSHPLVEGFIFWGLTEPTWADGIINPFRQDKTYRIAADSIYNLIQKQWNTDVKGKLDENGMFSFNGYYGQYDVMVKVNGVWKEFGINCSKANKGKTFDLNTIVASSTTPVLKKVSIVEPNEIHLTFDKTMANPTYQSHNFKIFDRKSNYVKSTALKAGDSKTVVLTTNSTIGKRDYIPVAFFANTYSSADGGMLRPFGYEFSSDLAWGYLSSATSGNGREVQLKFDNDLVDSTINASEYVVTVNGTTVPVSSAAVGASKNILSLKLQNQLTKGTDAVKVTYANGSLKRFDGRYLASFVSKTVTNTVVTPKLLTSTTNTTGSMIYLNFDVNMGSSKGLDSCFTLTSSKNLPYKVTKIETASVTKTRLYITLSTPINKGDVVTIKYVGTGLVSANEIPVANFTSAITNNSITGLDDMEDVTVTVTPNPFTDYIVVKHNGKYKTAVITDLEGRERVRQTLQAKSSETIRTSSLEKGVYLLVLSDGKLSSRHKIVKE